MKFRFSLQSVLEHREHLEEQARLALAKDVARLADLEAEKHRLEDELLHLPELQRSLGSVDGERRMQFVQWGTHLRSRIAAQNKRIEKQMLVVENRRKFLADRSRDRKAIEIIRDRQKQEFVVAERKRDAKRMDEAASTGFQRRLAEEAEHG